MYDRKERCQYKCQNVLAFLRISIRDRYTPSNIGKLRTRTLLSKKLLDNDFCECYTPKHSVTESFRYF